MHLTSNAHELKDKKFTSTKVITHTHHHRRDSVTVYWNKMGSSKQYNVIPLDDSMQIRYLHQYQKLSSQAICLQFPQYSSRSIRRHAIKSCRDVRGENWWKYGKVSERVEKPKSKQVSEKKKRKGYTAMPLDVSLHIRYLTQDLGLRCSEVRKRYPRYSLATIYRHAKANIGDTVIDKRCNNIGRPKVLSQRDKRMIVSQVPKVRRETNGNFTLYDLRKAANVAEHVSGNTVRRVLYNAGYGYRNKRRKGILTEKDVKLRFKFAKYAQKNLTHEFWTTGISFYLDGVGFTHKLNPCLHAQRNGNKTYRKRNEGCNLNCTAAGKREGDGGKVAKFMVTIAYGKGVTMCEELETQLNGKSFAEFVRMHFPACFEDSSNPDGKVFLQDGDPSQNSAVAMDAVAEVGGKKFGIPPRSPDLNPIENLFHLVKRKMRKCAVQQNIEHESYPEFLARIKATMMSIENRVIDNLIGSMTKRIDMVVKAKGQRIKY